VFEGLLFLHHAQELHLFKSEPLDILTCQDTSHPLLKEHARLIFLLFLTLLLQLSFSEKTHELGLFDGLLQILQNEHDTLTTLSASVVFLDDSNGLNDVDVKSERVLDDFSLWVSIAVILFH
jgi:hypothetical protein